MKTPRQLTEENVVTSALGVGLVFAVLAYTIGDYELSVLLAVIMPGVYWGFAFIAGDWLELFEETATMFILLVIFRYCFHQVSGDGGNCTNHDDNNCNNDGIKNVYYGPLSIGIHGLVDLLHHFHLYPSEKHVHTCCPKYPILCGLFDLTVCGTMCLLIYLLGE